MLETLLPMNWGDSIGLVLLAFVSSGHKFFIFPLGPDRTDLKEVLLSLLLFVLLHGENIRLC